MECKIVCGEKVMGTISCSDGGISFKSTPEGKKAWKEMKEKCEC